MSLCNLTCECKSPWDTVLGATMTQIQQALRNTSAQVQMLDDSYPYENQSSPYKLKQNKVDTNASRMRCNTNKQ